MAEETYELHLSGDGFQILPVSPSHVEQMLTDNLAADPPTDALVNVSPSDLADDIASAADMLTSKVVALDDGKVTKEDEEDVSGVCDRLDFLIQCANWSEDLLADLRAADSHLLDYPVYCLDGLTWSNRLVLASLSQLTRSMLLAGGDADSCLVIPDVRRAEFETFHRCLFSSALSQQEVSCVNRVAGIMGVQHVDCGPTKLMEADECGTIDYKKIFREQKEEFLSKVGGVQNMADFVIKISEKKMLSHQRWTKLNQSAGGGPAPTSDYCIVCEDCGRTFSDQATLNSHRETVHSRQQSGKPGRTFFCKYCARSFQFSVNVKRHVFVAHPDRFDQAAAGQGVGGNKENENLPRLENLMMAEGAASHAAESFQRVEELKCKVCGLYQKSKRSLILHIQEHFDTKTGGRGYKCEYPGCSSSFKEEAKLRRHKICHTGERPFECQYCKQKFSLKHNLKMHEKTHTKIGLLSCAYCDYTTVQKSNLKNHEAIHVRLGHTQTTDEELHDSQQITKPGPLKGKYVFQRKLEESRKKQELSGGKGQLDEIPGFKVEKMDLEEPNSGSLLDSLESESAKRDDEVEESADEIEKFLSAMEKETAEADDQDASSIFTL